MNIVPVIRDLLLRNQKAVVPGIGAFVLAQRPAQLNRVTRVLTPPSVTVKFDVNQQTDDGQLTGYLTQKLKLDAEVARKSVEDFRKEIFEKLKGEDSVALEGLGTLSLKKTGVIAFVPEEELLNRISLFEMPKIEVPSAPAEKVTPPPVTVPVVTSSKPAEEAEIEEYSGNRRWVIPVVLLGLLLGMLLVIYFTGNLGVLISDVKSALGVAGKDTTEQLVFGNDAANVSNASDTGTVEQISRKLDEQVNRENALDYKENDAVSNENIDGGSQAIVEPSTSAVTYAKTYHIIAGSFKVLKNAENQRYALQAKGLPAEILPRKGSFYMVSLGSYDAPEQASAALKEMQHKLSNELWVMRNQ